MISPATIRRAFLKAIALCMMAIVIPAFTTAKAQSAGKPNVIIIFIDDMGYGDLGCYGSEKNRTPQIDRMAAEGMRFTDFYVACSVCTPSRAALMTGCYPRRVNLHVDEKNLCVLFPGARKGLNPTEITIAEVLKSQGYATACIGKWHLGDHPDFLPTSQGFDYYYGIPYSNDMHRKPIPLPLVRNEKAIEAPVHQPTITKRYTEEAIRFIRKNKEKPFFVYLPHAMVHLPLHASKDFKGKSANGIYGDATEEIDWSTGEIIKTLKELGIDDNTLVVFTSDNGSTGRHGGSNVPLRGNKGRTDEGGMRVPCIMRYPGRIPANKVCADVSGTIDFLPTIAALSGARIPGDRIIDGKNIWPLMSAAPGAKSPHEAFYYYQMDQLQCVRSGKWKLHLPMDSKKRNWGKPEGKTPVQLFDLEENIAEDKDLSRQHPEVVDRLMKLADKMRQDIGDLDKAGANQRPAGWVEKAQPRLLEKM
ncbi:MAG: sulfatase [Kiritimatiellia bacterium]|jgi:arylsulfatase A-like enzyme|nr:sulfatase [Kiritimatiellia bacterium]MDP6847618.1 sulfatase [Kiritimatiellia bacterium]